MTRYRNSRPPDDAPEGPLLPEREEKIAIAKALRTVRPPFDKSPPLDQFLRRWRWTNAPVLTDRRR